MEREIEPHRSRPPMLRKAAAGLILIAAIALGVHIVIGVVVTIFWIAVALAVAVAVIWALKTIIW